MKAATILAVAVSPPPATAHLCDDTWYNVNWRLDGSAWKPTEPWVETELGISHYALYEQSWPRFYTYALYFYLVDGVSGWGRTWYFEDETGDVYQEPCFTDGSHSKDYDSTAPGIRRVKCIA